MSEIHHPNSSSALESLEIALNQALEEIKRQDAVLKAAEEAITALRRTGMVIPVDQQNSDAEALCRAFLDADTQASAALAAIRESRG